MNIFDQAATRWATPPSDKEWEALWGKEEAVPAAKTLFPWFVLSNIALLISLVFLAPFIASLCIASSFVIWKLRGRIFQKARVGMDSLESSDYVGIMIYLMPVAIAIWFFLGFLLSLFVSD